MKTLKSLTFLFSLLLISACSNDDDNAPRPQAAFPVTIQYTSDVGALLEEENLTINFEYNGQNNITLIETEDSANRVTSVQVSYSNGLVSEINTQSTFGNENYTFTYSNTNSGIIREVLRTDDDGTNIIIPVSYNNSSNAYTFNFVGNTFTLDLNADNYLEGISTPSVTYELFFNENETGPFVNVVPQPAIYFVTMFSPAEFYFFSPFELVRWDTSVAHQVINNRDADGNINSVEYRNLDTGANMDRMTISYENRSL